MEIRFEKNSHLIEEYLKIRRIWLQTATKSKEFEKIEKRLISKIKQRINIIYEALFENV